VHEEDIHTGSGATDGRHGGYERRRAKDKADGEFGKSAANKCQNLPRLSGENQVGESRRAEGQLFNRGGGG